MPDLWTILEWAFYGLVRYVMLWIPFVTPFRVDRWPPDMWWFYNNWNDWGHRDDNNGGPDEHWCQAWFRMVLGTFKALILSEAQRQVDQAKSYLRGLIGAIRSGFSSLGDWINWLQIAVGAAVPWWTSNLSAGLDRLRNWLPYEIVQGWRSWGAIWDNIKSEVRDWAHSQFDQAVAWARSARDWVNGVGDQLRRWRDTVSGWIDNFRANPYAYIAGVLGPGWSWLVGFWPRARDTVIGWLGPDWVTLTNFARDAARFYYNLWASGWRTLDDFVADPKGFVIDRLERVVMDRW